MEKAGTKQLVYFWFPMRGRILTTLYQVKIYNFWDALTRQRTDGALVRVITPVYGNEKVEDADARLAGFTKEIVPILDQFIPK
jgi:EpsI family protein